MTRSHFKTAHGFGDLGMTLVKSRPRGSSEHPRNGFEMASRHFAAIAVAFCAFSAGCATTPSVTYRYYPAKSSTILTITQTIDCNADKTVVFAVNTVQATTAYTADVAQKPFTLPIKMLDGWFADSDITFKTTEDGRLQSINQSTTGQGEAILKSAITLATAAAALGGAAPGGKAPAALPECDVIAARGGGKPVTLIYAKPVDLSTYGSAEAFVTLNDAPNDKGLYDLLQKQLPALGVQVHGQTTLDSGATYPSPAPDAGVVLLRLQHVARVQIDFTASGQAFVTSYVLVPLLSTYELPIPKARLFGKQNFALTLSDSGAISSIQYTKGTGAAAALNVLGTAATAAAPETAATKAADVKAQADLIAQQQRLARCQARPSQCQ